MFRSRITLEECLKYVQHEDAEDEDISLDNINMIVDLEEEDDVEIVEDNIFESIVLINMNYLFITTHNDFKDDK